MKAYEHSSGGKWFAAAGDWSGAPAEPRREDCHDSPDAALAAWRDHMAALTMTTKTCDKVLDTSQRCGQLAVARVTPGAYDRGDVGGWNACAYHADAVERTRHDNARGTVIDYFPIIYSPTCEEHGPLGDFADYAKAQVVSRRDNDPALRTRGR